MFKDDRGLDGQADFKRRHVDGEVWKKNSDVVEQDRCILFYLLLYFPSYKLSSSRAHRCEGYLLRVHDTRPPTWCVRPVTDHKGAAIHNKL